MRELEERHYESQQEIENLGNRTRQDLEQMQLLQLRSEAYIDASLEKMYMEQRRYVAAVQETFVTSVQPLIAQMGQTTLTSTQTSALSNQMVSGAQINYRDLEPTLHSLVMQISATTMSQRCPSGCRCQCHSPMSVRTPTWLRSVFGQLLWDYNSSISMKSCDYPRCRKSFGKHHFTFYFPTWLVSRAVVASATMCNLSGAGAKISVSVPLVIPEEDHMIWSIVIAGNLEQLRNLLTQDNNLVHVRNQWGQSILHISIIQILLMPCIQGANQVIAKAVTRFQFADE